MKEFLARCFGVYVAKFRENYVYVPEKLVKSKAPFKPKSSGEGGDDRFLRLADKVVADGRTFLSYDRLYVLWQAALNSYKLGLAGAEIGSFRGGSAYFLASAFRELNGEELPFHVFDTFEGHDASKIDEKLDPHHRAGKFKDTDYETVKSYLSCFKKLEAHKGEFSQSVKTLPETRFGFVHIDVDIYQSTIDCLDYFTPRLASGGVVVIDDFTSPTCQGVDLAVREYMDKHDEYSAWHPMTEQAIFVRK